MTTKITEQNISQLANAGVNWQPVVTADGSTGLTAVAGRGYFIDTTSGAITVTLPASPKIGDTITITDYASTFNTNNVTINPNGNKIEAGTANGVLSTNDQTHTLVFTDSTQGWKIVNQDTASGIQPTFISATGGTVTESGDFKIHTFTGDGCFVVSQVGNPLGSTAVDYLVVSGGGGGGDGVGADGGGGAGGYRESSGAASGCYSVSPLGSGVSALPVSATTYPIIVGGGGSASSGSNSVFSTITSTGGGQGGDHGGPSPVPAPALASSFGLTGGSGGGGGGVCSGISGVFSNLNNAGNGNTPPVNPSQGNNGGDGFSGYYFAGGGGGGAGAVGTDAAGPMATIPTSFSGEGGNGVSSSISGSPVTRGGGGGGSGFNVCTGAGGLGGGGAGTTCSPSSGPAVSGTTNTGGGGGGGVSGKPSAVGGSGIVIIRYKFQ